MYTPLRDVKLEEDELAEIEVEIEARGEMPAHNKQTLRAMMIREAKWWKWEGQDHMNGHDDGETIQPRNY